MRCLKCFALLLVLSLWPVLPASAPALGAPEPLEPPQTAPAQATGGAPVADPVQPEPPSTIPEVLKALENGKTAPFSNIDFESLVEFHKAEGDKTYTSISIAFRDGVVLQPFARLSALTEDATRYDFTEGRDFADSGIANASGLRVFQTGYAVPPGRYRLSAGVWDAAQGVAGGRTEEVVVPAFEGSKLELSSVTLASALERAPAADPTIKQPFIWGSFKVVPRVETSFPRQEPLRLYYQIYNASADPDTGKPRLSITYTFFQKKNGKFQRAAPPQTLPEQASQVALYELPLSGWPVGEFKVRIDARDAVTQASTSEEVLFKLR